jgi:hypothetical protein
MQGSLAGKVGPVHMLEMYADRAEFCDGISVFCHGISEVSALGRIWSAPSGTFALHLEVFKAESVPEMPCWI